MNTRINFRFLAILSATVLLVSIGLFFMYRWQTVRKAEQFLLQARAAQADGDSREAARLYARCVHRFPDSAEVQAEFADSLLEIGNLQQAFFRYENSLRLKGDQPKVRKNLVEMALLLDRASDAKTHLVNYLIPAETTNPEFQWLLGLCEQKLASFDKALEQFQSVVEIQPGEPRFAASLANLLTDRFARSAEARQVLDTLVAHDGSNAQSLLVRGQWLYNQARLGLESTSENSRSLLDAAWADAQAARQFEPQTPAIAILVANIAKERMDSEEARQVLTEAIQANPEVSQLYMTFAELEMQGGNLNQAATHLRQGLEQLPKNSELLWNLVRLEIALDNLDSAAELTRELRGQSYPEPPLRFLDAQLMMKAGRWREAADQLEAVRSQFDRSRGLLGEADFMLATCYRQMGNSDQELVSLRRAVSNTPSWMAPRAALAAALSRSGRNGEAITEYGKVIRQSTPNVPLAAALELAQLLLVDGYSRGDKADWTPLMELIEVVQSIPEATASVSILKAELLAAQGKLPEAEAELQSSLQLDAASAKTHQALVSLFIRIREWDRAEQAIAEARKAIGDSPWIQIEQARAHILRNGSQFDLDLLDQLAQPSTDWQEENSRELAEGFSSIFLSLGEYERAERQAMVVADSAYGRSNLSTQQLLFEIALRGKDLEVIDKALSRVGDIEGNAAVWRLGSAIRLVIEAEQIPDEQTEQREALFSKALNHLAEASGLRPAWSKIPQLQGEIYDRQKNPELAVRQYMNAIDLGERNPKIVSRVLFLLTNQGRYQEADKVVRAMQERQVPFSNELTKLATQVSLKLENYDRALVFASDLTAQADRPADHVWLGQIYASTNRLPEAEEQFRSVIDLQPENPLGWISLTQLYARQKKFDAVDELIRQAKESVPPEIQSETIAQCYEASGDFTNAEKLYLQAKTTSPTNWKVVRRLAGLYLATERSQEATPLLEQLVAAVTDMAADDQLWARRALAIILGLSGDQSQAKRALNLIDENTTQQAEATSEDRRAKAIILGARVDKKSLQDAIQLMEGVVLEQSEFSLNDNFRLAEMYLRSDDWPKYSRLMRSVMGNGGTDQTRYVRGYAQALVNRGELNEANIWFERLKELAPAEISTLAIEARMLFGEKQYTRALNLLENTNGEPDKLVAAAELAFTFADALDNSENSSQAEAFWTMAESLNKRVAQSDPLRPYALAAFYARRGSIEQALQAASQVELELELELTAEHKAQIGLNGLHSYDLSSENALRLINFLKADYEISPTAANLGICLADLYSWVGDWKNASVVYQHCLQQNPRDISALNNLALILALSNQQLSEARRYIDMALETHGPLHFLLDTRGLVNMAQKNWQMAESDFRMALETGASADKYFHLAMTLQAQGRESESKQALEQAHLLGSVKDKLHPLERVHYENLHQQ